MPPPIHLHPTAPLAERVLLPGDPGRALLLAQSLISEPKMFNHNRGLWGYSGPALRDGELLTIQSTGMGGPSAAIVIAELADLGAMTLLRTGTCAALEPGWKLGELLIAASALSDDGTSRALGAGVSVAPDPTLLARLRAAGSARSATVASTDLFYDTAPGTEARWRSSGAVAVEMEAATLFTLAARRGLRAGAVLIVTDLLLGPRRRIEPDALRDAEHQLGELAVGALVAEPASALGRALGG